MKEDVYNYLREYGLTKEELTNFEEINEKIFFVDLNEVKKNISFLINRGLTKDEIINVFRYNPFMITVKNNRLDALDKIYFEELLFSQEEIKQLINNNPSTYTESPIELQKIIDILKMQGHSIENIKNYILRNSSIISKTSDEFIKTLNNLIAN